MRKKEKEWKNEKERREVEEAREELFKTIGPIEPSELFRALTEARAQRDRFIARPRADADPNAVLRRFADINLKGLSVTKTTAPRGSITFGSTREFVSVDAKVDFQNAILRFKLSEKNIAHLQPDTIVVARWDAEGKRLYPVPQSGYNSRFGYAFSQITAPGLYTAIGIPRDPRILLTLQMMRAVQPWAALNSDSNFIPKVCGLILCSPPMMKAMKTRAGEFGFDVEDFVGGPPGRDLCEICLGGDRLFPELELFNTFDLVPGFAIPIVPPRWPIPCGKWENMGPNNISGRINALVAVDGNTLYAGSAAGGVFKSTIGGDSWSTNWENQLSLAIGGLAVAPSNTDVIYAATGEWDVSVSAIYVMYPGAGVYRSDDAGLIWRRLTPIPSLETSAVAVDPNDPDRVYVAGRTGLHRSRDGGVTWDVRPGRTYGVFDGTVTDVIIDPTNANIIYIGVHSGFATNGGLYKSTDRGDNWTLLTNGIVNGAGVDAPKIALGRNGAHGTQFVFVKSSNRLFISIDGGSTFNSTPSTAAFVPDSGRYMNVAAVDPTNEAILFAGDLGFFRSGDGGATWVEVGRLAPPVKNRIHDDAQAIAFDPTDHNRMFVATDGGVYRSNDNGLNWIALHGSGGTAGDPFVSTGLTTLQCWTIAVSQTPKLAYAVTTHDNWHYAQWKGKDFTPVNYANRGEGGWIEYDPKNPAVMYVDNWFYNIMKTTNGDQWWQGQTWTDLGLDTSNLNAETFRIAWNNTQILLAIERATGSIRRSANGGTSWTNVLQIAGVEFTSCNFAPSNDMFAYAASSDGRIWRSTDSGVIWTELLRAGLPNQRVHAIEVHWTIPQRVYLAFGTRAALGSIGYRPLWRGDTVTGNQAVWFDISGSTPQTTLPDLGLTGLALDPVFQDTIYVSNISGVYRSTDDGNSWQAFDDGLPNCFVSDLDIRKVDRTLWVSTMGRGVFRRRL